MTVYPSSGFAPSNLRKLESRAAQLLVTIESRCAYMWRESQRAIQAYFLAEHDDFPRRLPWGAQPEPKLRAIATTPLTIDDLERYTPYWQSLLPANPDLQAVLANLLARKYPFIPDRHPGIAAALRLDDDAVRESHARLYGVSLANLFEAEAQHVGQREAVLDPQEAALREAAAALRWIMVPSGGTLYRIGDEDDTIYAVISGRLRAVVPQEGGAEQTVVELGRGEMVGFTEVMIGEARATNVYAVRDSEVVCLSAGELRRLAERYPQVWASLNSILADRFCALLAGPRHTPNTLATFALVPAEPGAPIEEFSRRLVAGLAEYGPTFAIDSALVEDRLGRGAAQAGRDDLEQSQLVAWLSEQEVENRYVVYLSDKKPSAWSDRCLRQADRVLVVDNASRNAKVLGPCLNHIKEVDPQARVELILLHPSDCVRPAGTSRWLTGRPIERHYHVRDNSYGDLKRLVRRLTGHALGLVLGGGGARGWAHLGVWRALNEAGIEVDLVGGTSMGAIVGGTLAAGLDEAAVRELALEFSSPAKLFDLTLPIVSFFATGKVNTVLRRIFGDTQIEDLWLPFFCVATNVSRASQAVLTMGPLWEAVRASTAIPGIFAPILYEGDVLVDGAVLNNLPSDVMERFSGGGPIVAVNVFPDVDVVKDYQFDPSISGWEVLLKQLNPLRESMQVPWLFENLIRILSLNDVQQARTKRGLADVYIRPPVERFNILDFKAYEEIIEIGYEAACQQVDRWQKIPGQAQVFEQPPTEAAQVAPGVAYANLADELMKTLTDLEEVLNKR